MPDGHYTHIKDYFILLWCNTDYLVLFLGEVVTQFGNWFNLVASYQVVEDLTGGSGVALATLLVLRNLPRLVWFPFAGAVADTYNRGYVLLVVSLLQGLLAAAIPASLSFKSLWLFYAINFAEFSLTTFYDPARGAIIPMVVSQDKLILSSTLDSLAWSLMGAVGASMGGFAITSLGVSGCFYMDAITFIIAGLCALRVLGVTATKTDAIMESDSPTLKAANAKARHARSSPFSPKIGTAKYHRLESTEAEDSDAEQQADQDGHQQPFKSRSQVTKVEAASLAHDQDGHQQSFKSRSQVTKVEAASLAHANPMVHFSSISGDQDAASGHHPAVATENESGVCVTQTERDCGPHDQLAHVPRLEWEVAQVGSGNEPCEAKEHDSTLGDPRDGMDVGAGMSDAQQDIALELLQELGHTPVLAGENVSLGGGMRSGANDVGGGHPASNDVVFRVEQAPAGAGDEDVNLLASDEAGKPGMSDGSAAQGQLHAFREGFKYLVAKENRHILLFVTIKACGAMSWGGNDVVNAKWAEMESMHVLGGQAVTLGVIYSMVGVGCFLGPLFSNSLIRANVPGWMTAVAISFAMRAAGYMSLTVPNFWILLASSVFRSAGSNILWISSTALLQSTADNERQGCVFAFELAVYTAAMCVSTFLTGIGFDQGHWTGPFACFVLGVVTSVLLVFWSIQACIYRRKERADIHAAIQLQAVEDNDNTV